MTVAAKSITKSKGITVFFAIFFALLVDCEFVVNYLFVANNSNKIIKLFENDKKFFVIFCFSLIWKSFGFV